MNVLEEHGFYKIEDEDYKDWWVKRRLDTSLAEVVVRLNGSMRCDLRQDELPLLIKYLGE